MYCRTVNQAKLPEFLLTIETNLPLTNRGGADDAPVFLYTSDFLPVISPFTNSQ